MSLLPVKAAHELADCPEDKRWLIEGLWADQAVGIVGGEPKVCKSILALDLAVAVASGTPCLRRYPVPQAGRVLLFNGEDALHVVKRRLQAIGVAAGVELEALDVHVITAPSLRLDAREDQNALAETVAKLKPRLLVLDPFVRMHRIDENAAQEVAPLLGYLRDLQRRHQVAVLVVHHFRKGSGRSRQGQALRGSSEFHSWGDSNLYLRRAGEDLMMAIEHRAAASAGGIKLRLATGDDAVSLEVIENTQPELASPESTSALDKVVQVLHGAGEPLNAAALQRAARIRSAHLWQALRELVHAGRVVKVDGAYQMAGPPTSASRSTIGPAGSGSGKLAGRE